MKFDYILKGAGWAEFIIEKDEQRYQSYPSYLTEPLEDLLDGLIKLLFPDNNPKHHSFIIEMEPEIDIWTLGLNNNSLRITIDRLDDFYSEEPKTIFDIKCNFEDFIEVVVDSLKELIKYHGIVGYKSTWNGHDFPLSNFITLKYYSENKLNTPIIEKEKNIFITDINEELTLINKYVN